MMCIRSNGGSAVHTMDASTPGAKMVAFRGRTMRTGIFRHGTVEICPSNGMSNSGGASLNKSRIYNVFRFSSLTVQCKLSSHRLPQGHRLSGRFALSPSPLQFARPRSGQRHCMSIGLTEIGSLATRRDSHGEGPPFSDSHKYYREDLIVVRVCRGKRRSAQ